MNLDPNSPSGAPQLNLALRPMRDDDEPFIKALRAHADTERLLFDHSTLEEEEKKLLLNIQFEAHQRHYKDVDWDKKECVIEFDGQPAGYVIVMQDKEEIRLADIVISPQFQGLGVGFAIIQSVQGEAMQSERVLRLHVEPLNPALAIYEQMGFRVIEDRVTHLFMEWTPPNMQGKKLYFPGS